MTDTTLEMSNDTVGSEGIFLRTADRRRFDYVMRGVQQQSLSLALSAEHDGVLDHYGRLVINKLRKMDDLQIEVFLPQNTEALLDRFNQILSGLSLDDARNGDSSPAPRRVLIAHDAKAISARDLQLLSRLVQDFPGANVSLVLFLDRTGIGLHEKSLDNFGQRMLRWPLEQPTRAEGEALLKVARSMGFEVEVKKVLAATGFAEVKTTPPAAEATGFERQPTEARNRKKSAAAVVPAAAAAAGTKTSDGSNETTTGSGAEGGSIFSEPPKRGSAFKTLLNWTLALALLLALSVGTLMLAFPQRLSPMLANSPTLKATLPPWMMELVVQLAGKPPAPPPEPDPTSAAPAGTQSVTVPGPGADKETTVPPATADSSANKTDTTADKPAAAEIAVAPDSGTAKPAEPAVAGDTGTADTAANKTPADDALAPRSERGVDQSIRQAPAGSIFVQHVSVNSMAEAQEWRAQYRALSGARIAAVTLEKKGVRYVLISGPFANMKEAETFARKEGVPADPWLRPVKSLQRALQPANR
jgi:hypothetical protein